MSLGPVLRILLAAALLSAQYAALAHQIWHVGEGKTQPAQKQLCGQHDALGTVAGAVDAPTAVTCDETLQGFSDPCVVLPVPQPAGLAPSSRGPPAFS